MPDDAEISALPEATAVDGSFTVVGVQGGVTKRATLAVVQEGVVPVFSRTVELTNAQILALPTTPFDLVPAPGIGKLILPVAAYFHLDPTGGSYTNIASASWILRNAGGVFSDVVSSRDFLGQNGYEPCGKFSMANITAGTGDLSGRNVSYDDLSPDTANLALTLADNVGGTANGGNGNYTGGNAANTLTVTVLYSIINV